MEIHGGPSKRRRRKPADPNPDDIMSRYEEESDRIARWQATSLAEVGLSVRNVTTLEANDVMTLGQLCQLTVIELQNMPNLGKVTITRCREILNGLHLPHRLDE